MSTPTRATKNAQTLSTGDVEAMTDLAALQQLEDHLRAVTAYVQAQKDLQRHLLHGLGDPEPSFRRKRDDAKVACPAVLTW